MGFGFGGEWAVGAILIGETVRARYRGRAVGTVQSGWAVGWGVAVGLYVLTQSLFPPETAWRLLFALGVLPALGVFWIRRHVPEPEVFVRHADRRGDRPSFLGIFRPDLLRTTVVCALLCTGAQGGYYSLTTFLPQFLRSARGLDVLGIGGTLLLVIRGARRVPLRRLAHRPARAQARARRVRGGGVRDRPAHDVAEPAHARVHGARAAARLRGLGVLQRARRLLTEQYPTELRGSGQGFCYNFGRGIGALFPLLVGLLADALSIGVAIAMFAGIAYLVMAFCALLLPETRGAELTGTVP